MKKFTTSAGNEVTKADLYRQAVRAGVDFAKRFKKQLYAAQCNLAHLAHGVSYAGTTSEFFSMLKQAGKGVLTSAVISVHHESTYAVHNGRRVFVRPLSNKQGKYMYEADLDGVLTDFRLDELQDWK